MYYYHKLFAQVARDELYFAQAPDAPANGELPKLRLRQLAADADYVLTIASAAPSETRVAQEAQTLYVTVFTDCGAVHGFYLTMVAALLTPSRGGEFKTRNFLRACEHYQRKLLSAKAATYPQSPSAKGLVEISERLLEETARTWDAAFKRGEHPWDRDLGVWR